MLQRIVNILKSSNYRFEDGTVFCKSYTISDLPCILFLEEKNVLENILSSKKEGIVIDLELSLAHLNSLGFYEDCETFVLKNKFKLPSALFYIEELDSFSTDDNEFVRKYTSVINLISGIKKISKYSYLETDIENSIIYRDNQSIFLAFDFDFNDIKSLKGNDIDKLDSIAEIFANEIDSEKKLVFINQLIEVLTSKEENFRFKFLLSQIVPFYEKSNNAYQFYLRDFSYNKLKIELDSKALEYTQKIQAVINDSQTKLIAIPTAFVLAFAAFDFTNSYTIKNVAIILSLIVFATLIQLFLNNQKSTLNFIAENIDSYKETFLENSIENVSSKFSLVGIELKKQRNRLRIMEIINWGIPVLLFCLWLFILKLQIWSISIFILFIAFMIILEISTR